MSGLSRRTFFQGATAALSATHVMGANDRIGIGIIGLGGRGGNHIDYYNRIDESQITAVCDVNQAARERAQAAMARAGKPKPQEYGDMRKLFEDKNVDAVSMATPNHWHSLGTIWACRAGKDVYCEKPASYNVHESRKMVEVARATKRMVQIGSQGRSAPHKIKAMQMLKDGAIGKLYLAKGLCFKKRDTIGKTPEQDVPPGIDWDMFLGPAPMRKFTMKRYKYNWHWFWDTGNGDIGNQGVHQMDVCRWGMGDPGFPKSVVSTGGKYLFDDDQETPNTQLSSFMYDGFEIVFEVRGLMTGGEGDLGVSPGGCVANFFYGSDGWMRVDDRGFSVFKGWKSEKASEEQAARGPGGGDPGVAHVRNFLEACRTRDYTKLAAEVEIGAMSANLCHLANVSYRAGKRLEWDAARAKFVAAPDADKLLTRDYRKPYVV